MAKFDVYEPLLAPSNMQSVVRGLQVVPRVRRFVDDSVAVWIPGLIGRPAHVCKVSCDAIAVHLDIAGFEPVVSEQSVLKHILELLKV
jgi:hypothetical protein